jgi:predicted nucleic acid-binding protein
VVKALFDTNVLIDHLRGRPAAATELSRYEACAISIVTWIEIMVGAPADAEAGTREFLGGFALIALDQDVAAVAVSLRQRYRLKLPDAIIWASARAHGLLFVTRDTKDFPADDPGIRVPY